MGRGNRLEKLILFTPIRDEQGRFIPYCDFGWHQGIVRQYIVCEERRCKHYHKFYIKVK